jgi:multiple sugar transport system substrate-binding protein
MKKIVYLLLSQVMIIALVACSQAATAGDSEPSVGNEASSDTEVSSDAEAPSEDEEPADAEDVSNELVTLDLWIFEGEEDFLSELEADFEVQYPDIDLVITVFPEDEYVTKIDTALTANTPPDIGFVYEPRWVKAGHFLEITDLVDETGISLEDYNQAALSANCLVEGKLYCFGSYSGIVALFYNKDLFDAAGQDYLSTTVPMTIDEYAELAAALSTPSDDMTQYVWGGTAPPHYWWMDWRTGFSEDGRITEGYINDETTVHTYDVLSGMVKDGYAPSSSTLSSLGLWFDAADLMAQGKIAMQITDNFQGVELLEAQGIKYGVAPVPVENGDAAPWVPSWTDAWGIFAASDAQEAGYKFLKFTIENAGLLRAEVGALPLSVKDAEATGWDSQGYAQGREDILDVVGLARPNIFVPGFWNVTWVLEDAFIEISEAGDTTAQEALNDVASTMQEQLDLEWETWDSIE